MKYILNENLIPDDIKFNNEYSIKIDGKSRRLSLNIPNKINGLFDLLSKCYSTHQKVRINPHDIWYIIQTEITKLINKEPKTYRSLFTDSPRKIELKFPTNSVETLDPMLIFERLTSLMKFSPNLFVKTFSTSTPEVILAGVASLAESASNYYSYTTFMCGIPEIEFGGTLADWAQLKVYISELSNPFKDTKVSKYLTKVYTLIERLTVAFEENDVNYIKNIFTQKNVGSGVELTIDGWITDLYAEVPSLKKLENFKYTYSIIPYKNLETGREFRSIYGGFEAIQVNDFYELEYISFVYNI